MCGDICEISDWGEITSQCGIKAGFVEEEVTCGKRQLTSSGLAKITRWLGSALRQAQELLRFRHCLLQTHFRTLGIKEKAIYLLIKHFTSLSNGAWIVKGSN